MNVAFKELVLQEETEQVILHFWLIFFFFLNVGGFLHFTFLAYCLVSPSSWNENQFRLQVRARNASSSALNVCQSQQMIDQSWNMNSNHLCGYEMLNGFLPPNWKRWQLFVLEIIQFSFPLINLHFAAFLWLELPPTAVYTIRLVFTVVNVCI